MHEGSKSLGNKVDYYICLIVICHGYKHFCYDKDFIPTIFQNYLKENNVRPNTIDFEHFLHYLQSSDRSSLKKLTNDMMRFLFESK